MGLHENTQGIASAKRMMLLNESITPGLQFGGQKVCDGDFEMPASDQIEAEEEDDLDYEEEDDENAEEAKHDASDVSKGPFAIHR